MIFFVLFIIPIFSSAFEYNKIVFVKNIIHLVNTVTEGIRDSTNDGAPDLKTKQF